MEKKCYSFMRTAAVAVLFSLSAMPQTSVAQDIPALKQSDYTVPTWTLLRKAVSELTSSAQPYSINMTVNGDPCTRMAFAWFTNPTMKTGKVQIVANADAKESDFATPTLTLDATSSDVKDLNYVIAKNGVAGIETDTKMSYTSHKALAENLTPGTTYSYRVGNEDGWSEIGHFTTAQRQYDVKEGYSFIYITDTQAQTDEMFDVSQKTVHAAQKMVPNAKFVLCNGDLVETSGSSNSEWEWEQWFSTMQDVWMNYPLVVAQGNHDTSTNSNFAWHFNTDASFNAESAVKTKMEGTVYSFVYGDILFMVINYEDYATDGYFAALADWMKKQVEANSTVKWRIATFHKNMFTGSGSHQDDSDGKKVREAMLPVFDELKIDIALQGHDHIYEVVGPVNNVTKTLVDGAVEHVETVDPSGVRENMTGKAGGIFNVNEGTLYFLNNSAGKKKYEPRNETTMINSIGKHDVENYWGLFSGKFGQTGEPTFSNVKVTSDTIFISTYTVNDSGNASLFDSFKVIKENKGTGLNAASEQKVKIYGDNAQKRIVVEGIEPESVVVYSTNGDIIANSTSKTISTVGMSQGLYIVKVTRKNDSYYGKVMLN
ncbi:fibronectin type III domain-containing protein [Bacteroides sp.]